MKFHDELDNIDYTLTKVGENRWEMTTSKETVDLYERPITRIIERIGTLTDEDIESIVSQFNTYDSIYQIA